MRGVLRSQVHEKIADILVARIILPLKLADVAVIRCHWLASLVLEIQDTGVFIDDLAEHNQPQSDALPHGILTYWGPINVVVLNIS